jgi:signal transduction histidine kinase
MSHIPGFSVHRLLEILLATGAFAALAGDIVSSGEYRGPAWMSLVGCATCTLPWIWRVRAPLAFAVLASASAIVLAALLGSRDTSVLPVYATLVPAYAVAAHADRGRARVGLLVCLAGVITLAVLGPPTAVGYAVGIALCVASWIAGREMRDRRMLAAELDDRAGRLAAERHDRQRLAVADERTRIARELHAVIAGQLSAIVIQTTAAQRLLDEAPEQADEAMAAIEQAGREVLGEMRRVLGVLRRGGDGAERAPQPGLGEIHTLLEQVRGNGADVELHVDGEPAPIPASIDVALHRLIEEGLAGAPTRASVRLTFRPLEVELQVDTPKDGHPSPWPTLPMRERITLCNGTVTLMTGTTDRLTIRLPRRFDGAAA